MPLLRNVFTAWIDWAHLLITSLTCSLADMWLVMQLCIPVSSVVGGWQLRSADIGTLVVPGTRSGLRSIGESLLCQARPHETTSSSLSSQTFAKKLKNCLFGWKRLWRLSFNWRYINMRIHLFIHSSVMPPTINSSIVFTGNSQHLLHPLLPPEREQHYQWWANVN